VVIPPNDVLFLTSSSTIPSMQPGVTRHITLRIQPSIDTPFGEFTGSIGIGSNITSLNIGFRFTIVSNEISQLTVFVEDEVRMSQLFLFDMDDNIFSF
jgi:hypothetical protein